MEQVWMIDISWSTFLWNGASPDSVYWTDLCPVNTNADILQNKRVLSH